MRRAISCLAVLVFLVCDIHAAVAATRAVVHPTGDPDIDVAAVQAAVDSLSGKKGVVVLKARNRSGVPTAFNFGEDGSVVIAGPPMGSIVIRGERGDDDDDDDDGYATTAIDGGRVPIFMQRDAHLTVRNIEFRGAFLHAIHVAMATGAVIRDNVFLDTVGFPDFTDPPGCDFSDPNCVELPLTRVVYIGALFGNPSLVTGEVLIDDNLIDTAIAGYSDGVAVLFTEAKATIRDNHISGVNVGIRDFTFDKPLIVRDNHVVSNVPAPGFFSSAIHFGDFEADAFVRIEDNYASSRDDTLQGGAIAVAPFAVILPLRNVRVTDNDLHIVNGFSAVDIFALSFGQPAIATDNVVAENDISGTGLFGVSLTSFSVFGDLTSITLSGNRVSGNDFSGLEGEVADILFDAGSSGNTARIGSGDTVLDEGIGNVVIIDDDDEDDDDDD